MSKIVIMFGTVVVFMMGLSIGMYYGVNATKENVVEEERAIDSVQDVVIKHIQSEAPIVVEEKVEALAIEQRISPYAKMIIEKMYKKCGHTTMKEMDVPKELVNLTKEELMAKYSGWEVKNFSSNEFTLYRVIDANCEDHFVLKEDGGYVAVFNEMTDDVISLVEKTSILVEDLREEDKHDLENGIEVFGKETVERIIDTFI